MTTATMNGKLQKAKKSGISLNLDINKKGDIILNNATADSLSLIHWLISESDYEVATSKDCVIFTGLYANGREMFAVYSKVFCEC